MKLRNFTIALALLAPTVASAGPLGPTAALTNELEGVDSSYEAPLTGSQSQAIQTFSAPVYSSHYVYETSFTVSLSRFIPNNESGGNGNGNGNGNGDTPGIQTPTGPQEPTPVPEPSTLLLMGSAAAIAAVRKARAARKQTATIQ
jgi:hypothetical protein